MACSEEQKGRPKWTARVGVDPFGRGQVKKAGIPWWRGSGSKAPAGTGMSCLRFTELAERMSRGRAPGACRNNFLQLRLHFCTEVPPTPARYEHVAGELRRRDQDALIEWQLFRPSRPARALFTSRTTPAANLHSPRNIPTTSTPCRAACRLFRARVRSKGRRS